MTEQFEKSFLRTLVGDVMVARAAIDGDAEGAGRRNMVRAPFAAIEGAMWLVREHVLKIAADMDTLTPLAALALREQTYAVTGKGAVIEQMRAVTLGTAIRLVESQTRLIDPEVRVRYDHSGWEALQIGLRVRNRITHPKSVADLSVSDTDLAKIDAGFHWFLATIEYVMASASQAHRLHADATRFVIDALIAGDPETLRDYEDALAASESTN